MSTVTLSVSGASPVPDENPAGAVRGRGRAGWSGLLRLGLVAIPVKAYAATATAPETPCHQLHAGCGQRIRYEKRCTVHGPVEAGAIVSGYQYAPDQHLVLDEADLDRLRPAKDRALALERCLEISQLNPVLFSGRSLYLLPDGPAAHPPYALLVHVFQERQQAALGQVVLGQRRQLALVRPDGRLLAVHVLHYPTQLRCRDSFEEELRPSTIGAAESRLAGLLIDACSQPVRWSEYRDDSAEQLAALVEAKLQGHTPEAPAVEETPILSLLDALQQSVAAAQQRVPAAAGKKGKKKTARRSA